LYALAHFYILGSISSFMYTNIGNVKFYLL
jgi:hypothetical protein